MAAHIQVVLKQDVDNLGRAGQIVKVRPGYARNYLLPRSLAAVATRSNMAQVEHERQLAVAAAAKLKKSAEALAAQIQGQTVEVRVQAGEGDKLFGSVTSRDVSDALARKGVEVDRKKLVLPDHIKQLGEYDLTIKLGTDVTASFKLIVARAP
jgi:large subunit ribosomal protein L9